MNEVFINQEQAKLFALDIFDQLIIDIKATTVMESTNNTVRKEGKAA